MVFNGINFYPAAAEMSQEDFIKHEKHHGLTDDQLKEVWKLLQKDKKKEEKTK